MEAFDDDETEHQSEEPQKTNKAEADDDSFPDYLKKLTPAQKKLNDLRMKMVRIT